MNFKESVHTCLVKKYATFTGRATRSEYWWYVLFEILLINSLACLSMVLHFLRPIVAIMMVGIVVPSLSVKCRRLHDIGKSGWWQLIAVVPALGYVILTVLFCIDSKPVSKY